MAAKTLVTNFDDVHEAERAVQKLQADGFEPDGLGWVEHAHGRDVAHGNLVVRRNASAVTRVTIGGVLGALGGALILLVSLTVFHVDRATLIAAAVAGGLIGMALGVVVGRRLDDLASTEVARSRAHRYSGAATVMVTVDDDEEEARALEIIRGEASLHRHRFSWRVPAETEGPQRRSLG